jgi:phosphoglycerol transferase MdoB-like AlkP superfamily enzyme
MEGLRIPMHQRNAWTGFIPSALFVLLILFKLMFARSIILDSGFTLLSLKVEFPVVMMMTLVIELVFRRRRSLRLGVYAAADVLISFILFALVVYYQYYGAIATFHALLNLNQTGEIGASIASLIRPAFWLLFADLPFAAAALLLIRRVQAPLRLFREVKHGFVYGMLLFFAMAVLALWNTLNSIGGGTLNELKKAEGMGLLTYQAYVVYVDLKRDYLPVYAVNPQAIRAEKRLHIPEIPGYFGAAEGKDLYVIQLESFQNFLIGLEIDGQPVTPNLNRLADESFYFTRVYQQIAKGNTSDAEFVTNTSLYPTGRLPMSKETAGRRVPSLARLLEERGYETMTFHTNEAVFWDRNEMYPALGFDRFYDKAFFGEEDFIAFGASDEVLYAKSLDVIRDAKQSGTRVYANFVSMSSHNPFKLPPEKQMLHLPDKLEGTFLGDYLQAAHYADYALGKFIEALKDQELWDDALLVVYGDHFGFHDNTPEEEQRIAAELIGVPAYTKVQMFNIPLIIHVPGLPGETRGNVGGQIDILPTAANLLGIDLRDMIVFGQDLLNHTDNLIAERVYLPSGSFINEEAMVIPGSSLADAVVLPLDPSEPAKPAETYRDDYGRALRLLQMSDSYVNALPEMGDE